MTTGSTALRAPALALLLALAGTGAAQACTEIRFARGAFSGEVVGVTPPDGIVCHTIAVGDGQRMRVRVIGGNATAFNIAGVVENQDDAQFLTRAGTYRIDVYQTFRSVQSEPYRLVVEVR